MAITLTEIEATLKLRDELSPALNIAARNLAAANRKIQAIGNTLGLDLVEGSTGGGSDGNFTGALGIPTLDGLGVPGHGAHADHEHIEVDQIAGRAALLLALLAEL